MYSVGRKSLWSLLLVVVVVTLLVLLAQSLWTLAPTLFGRPEAKPRPITPRGDLAADEKSTIELFREASPSVVYITTQVVRRDAFSLNLLEIPRGTGSGIVWDQQGHIVTNFHVIQGADQAQVRLSDNSSWDATLVGSAPEQDLVVLQISCPSSRLEPIPIGIARSGGGPEGLCHRKPLRAGPHPDHGRDQRPRAADPVPDGAAH